MKNYNNNNSSNNKKTKNKTNKERCILKLRKIERIQRRMFDRLEDFVLLDENAKEEMNEKKNAKIMKNLSDKRKIISSFSSLMSLRCKIADKIARTCNTCR